MRQFKGFLGVEVEYFVPVTSKSGRTHAKSQNESEQKGQNGQRVVVIVKVEIPSGFSVKKNMKICHL